MQFSYRVYNESNESLLAVADTDLLGRTFEDGELVLSITEFYQGDKCDTEEIVSLLKSATIINAVGKDIISVMEKERMINKNSVLNIKGVPHAQVVVMK